jgi:hypothetical protein
MRSLLHSKPKIDDAELEIVRSRTAVRLAELLGGPADRPDETIDDWSAAESAAVEWADDGPDAEATPSAAVPSTWPRPRPIIIVASGEKVERDADRSDLVADEVGSGQAELVAVMARRPEGGGQDDWELPSPIPDPDALESVGQGSAMVREASEPSAPMAAAPERSRAEASATSGPIVLEPVGTPAVHLESWPSAPIGSDDQAPDRDGRGRALGPRAPSTSAARLKGRAARAVGPPPTAFCPYCALLLEPPPESTRRCARCRQRIVVKRLDGRAAYLTEAAVLVLDAERRRVAAEARLSHERERWLRLAAAAGASASRGARLATARPTEAAVGAAKALYLGAMDRAFKDARRSHEWETAARIRREQAMALYRVAGSPLPPPADLVSLYREGVLAELRGVAEIARDAELAGSSCCDACRADDRRILRIASELRIPRLPHDGCPRGLCRCSWDLAARDRTTMRRYLRRRPRPEPHTAPEAPPTAS